MTNRGAIRQGAGILKGDIVVKATKVALWRQLPLWWLTGLWLPSAMTLLRSPSGALASWVLVATLATSLLRITLLGPLLVRVALLVALLGSLLVAPALLRSWG